MSCLLRKTFAFALIFNIAGQVDVARAFSTHFCHRGVNFREAGRVELGALTGHFSELDRFTYTVGCLHPVTDLLGQVVARKNELLVISQDATKSLEPVAETHMPQLLEVLGQVSRIVT